MRTITIEEHFSLPQEHQRLKEIMNAPDCSPTTSFTVGAALAVFEKMIDLGEGRLADMDAAGIDMQIIQLTAAYFDQLDKQTVTSLCRESNDILSQAARSHPDRFAGFAQLPMKDPDAAVKELERCVTKLGFNAAVWSGMANGPFLDHPSFFPILAEAERLDVPIYIHPAPTSKEVFDKCYSGLGKASGIFALAGWGMHMESGTHSFRLILSGLFDRLPKLQIITGHMVSVPTLIALVRRRPVTLLFVGSRSCASLLYKMPALAGPKFEMRAGRRALKDQRLRRRLFTFPLRYYCGVEDPPHRFGKYSGPEREIQTAALFSRAVGFDDIAGPKVLRWRSKKGPYRRDDCYWRELPLGRECPI